jgi:RimJ/RimL family protein N-acetyltransferase
MSSFSSQPPIPIPFEKPYDKPSYLLGGAYSALRVYDNLLIDKEQLIKGIMDKGKFVRVGTTDNILYKTTPNGDRHIFLQVCAPHYTAREHGEAQAIRAKKLGQLDFLYRQFHKDNTEALLHQMQQILNTTPSLAALRRIQDALDDIAADDDDNANVVGIYEISIPSTLQPLTFVNSRNNYTSLYLNLKSNQNQNQNQKKNHSRSRAKKYYPIPKLQQQQDTKKIEVEEEEVERPKRKRRMLRDDDDDENNDEPLPKKQRVETVRLERLEHKHFLQLSAIADNSKVMQYIGKGQPWTKDKVLQQIENAREDWPKVQKDMSVWMHWAIMLEDDVVGYLAIHPEKALKRYSLTYFVDHGYQRQRIGTRALHLAIAAFKELRPGQPLYASVHQNNEAGKKFLEKNNFVPLDGGRPRLMGKIFVVDYLFSF